MKDYMPVGPLYNMNKQNSWGEHYAHLSQCPVRGERSQTDNNTSFQDHWAKRGAACQVYWPEARGRIFKAPQYVGTEQNSETFRERQYGSKSNSSQSQCGDKDDDNNMRPPATSNHINSLKQLTSKHVKFLIKRHIQRSNKSNEFSHLKEPSKIPPRYCAYPPPIPKLIPTKIVSSENHSSPVRNSNIHQEWLQKHETETQKIIPDAVSQRFENERIFPTAARKEAALLKCSWNHGQIDSLYDSSLNGREARQSITESSYVDKTNALTKLETTTMRRPLYTGKSVHASHKMPAAMITPLNVFDKTSCFWESSEKSIRDSESTIHLIAETQAQIAPGMSEDPRSVTEIIPEIPSRCTPVTATKTISGTASPTVHGGVNQITPFNKIFARNTSAGYKTHQQCDDLDTLVNNPAMSQMSYMQSRKETQNIQISNEKQLGETCNSSVDKKNSILYRLLVMGLKQFMAYMPSCNKLDKGQHVKRYSLNGNATSVLGAHKNSFSNSCQSSYRHNYAWKCSSTKHEVNVNRNASHDTYLSHNDELSSPSSNNYKFSNVYFSSPTTSKNNCPNFTQHYLGPETCRNNSAILSSSVNNNNPHASSQLPELKAVPHDNASRTFRNANNDMGDNSLVRMLTHLSQTEISSDQAFNGTDESEDTDNSPLIIDTDASSEDSVDTFEHFSSNVDNSEDKTEEAKIQTEQPMETKNCVYSYNNKDERNGNYSRKKTTDVDEEQEGNLQGFFNECKNIKRLNKENTETIDFSYNRPDKAETHANNSDALHENLRDYNIPHNSIDCLKEKLVKPSDQRNNYASNGAEIHPGIVKPKPRYGCNNEGNYFTSSIQMQAIFNNNETRSDFNIDDFFVVPKLAGEPKCNMENNVKNSTRLYETNDVSNLVKIKALSNLYKRKSMPKLHKTKIQYRNSTLHSLHKRHKAKTPRKLDLGKVSRIKAAPKISNVSTSPRIFESPAGHSEDNAPPKINESQTSVKPSHINFSSSIHDSKTTPQSNQISNDAVPTKDVSYKINAKTNSSIVSVNNISEPRQCAQTLKQTDRFNSQSKSLSSQIYLEGEESICSNDNDNTAHCQNHYNLYTKQFTSIDGLEIEGHKQNFLTQQLEASTNTISNRNLGDARNQSLVLSRPFNQDTFDDLQYDSEDIVILHDDNLIRKANQLRKGTPAIEANSMQKPHRKKQHSVLISHHESDEKHTSDEIKNKTKFTHTCHNEETPCTINNSDFVKISKKANTLQRSAEIIPPDGQVHRKTASDPSNQQETSLQVSNYHGRNLSMEMFLDPSTIERQGTDPFSLPTLCLDLSLPERSKLGLDSTLYNSPRNDEHNDNKINIDDARTENSQTVADTQLSTINADFRPENSIVESDSQKLSKTVGLTINDLKTSSASPSIESVSPETIKIGIEKRDEHRAINFLKPVIKKCKRCDKRFICSNQQVNKKRCKWCNKNKKLQEKTVTSRLNRIKSTSDVLCTRSRQDAFVTFSQLSETKGKILQCSFREIKKSKWNKIYACMNCPSIKHDRSALKYHAMAHLKENTCQVKRNTKFYQKMRLKIIENN